jgi:hypothetical protein
MQNDKNEMPNVCQERKNKKRLHYDLAGTPKGKTKWLQERNKEQERDARDCTIIFYQII